MIDWIHRNWIEMTGVLLALLYLFLEIKQQWTMWVVGIISSALYVYINFEARLYALTGLNACYVILSSYGLYRWKLAKDKEEQKTTRVEYGQALVLGLISLVFLLVIYLLLIRFTDSTMPFSDALVASFSIVATWMAAQKIIEHWLVWILVNYFSVGLYFVVGLYPTMILFVIYGTMSIVGWFNWKKWIKK